MGKSFSSHDVNNNGWGVMCTSGLNLFAFSVSVTVNVPAAPLSDWRISDTAPATGLSLGQNRQPLSNASFFRSRTVIRYNFLAAVR